jgi:uncharacterized repeat protein (TIGR02543 family)
MPGTPVTWVDDAYAAGTNYTTTVTGTLDYAKAFQVLNLVNSERAKEGLAPLKMSKDLLDIARIRSAEVSIYFEHTRPSGASCFTAAGSINGAGMLAENIAYGYSTAESVMTGWMNSPGHKTNILRSELTEIGVGCFVDQSGRTNWVQFFASRTSPAVASQPANATESFTIQANTDYVTKVTFDSQGGSAVRERYISHDPVGSSYTCGSLSTPTRAGYDFNGWFTAPEGGAKVNANTTLSGNVTLYAQWSSRQYTVTFDPRGGECSVASATREYGTEIGELPTPVRTGYTFVAWYNNANGERVYDYTRVTGNMTLYATWEESKTDAGAVDNNDDGSDKNEQDPNQEAPSDNTTGSTSTTGSTNTTGSTSTGSTNTTGATNTTNSTNTKNMTESGKSATNNAVAKTYKVKFNVNKGKALSKSKRSKLVKKGKAIGTFAKANRSGYAFKGWFTKKKGGKKITAKYIVRKNMTLYAHWEKNK